MTVCEQCGRESGNDARFCAGCGAPLTPNDAREERKVVSVLFADLVGSTSRAAQLDPEDVRTLLRAYYADLREELEHFGGTVEKFIGDAVVAVFGAPVAHEDDPERAVRAALAIRRRVAAANDADPGRNLHVRVAVCTGEALITLGARPSEGEAIAAGDVMNTAARLQAAAPVDGVLVDDATFRATSRAVVYKEHPAVVAKGKEEPVEVHEAVEPRARHGVDLGGQGRAELVGRTTERSQLVSALARARAQREPQLVTLVGVPGIGKSRLVRELWEVVDDDPELISWRQGRCLSYGEGVAFWGLAEIVKAQAGILENDGADDAEMKLAAAVSDAIDDESEARWVERHLRPLVGLVGDGSGERGETFAAWRRFFEGVGEHGPLVLVFEDLHWADDGLLDFVDQLPDRLVGIPLLVVCTARPELLERRPGWGGGKRNALTTSLSPLSDVETAQLVASLLGTPVLDAELQAALLARAGGNPLYAEEYVRMIADGEPIAVALPETIQGIVAARIDLLPPGEKSLLQDASALGKVFWTDGLAALAGSSAWELDERLLALERKEFVRREGRSAVAGARQYAFLHVLVRDVAYGQLPRAERLTRHLRAVDWIESLESDRTEDRSEMLAHHYVQALGYGRAAGVDVSVVAEGAARALRDAGDRAWGLGALDQALRYYEESLPLAAPRERPYHLLRIGRARASITEQGIEELQEALDGLLELGDAVAAAKAAVALAEAEWGHGDKERAVAHLERASDIVAAEGSDARARAPVVNEQARYLMLAGHGAEAVELADEGIRLAEEIGDVQLLGAALNNRGVARVSIGDPEGVGDIERAIELVRGVDWHESIRAGSNLGSILYALGDVARAEAVHLEALALADRFEDSVGQRWISTELAQDRVYTGGWDDALRRADAMIESCREQPHYMEIGAWLVRARIMYARGVASGLPDVQRALQLARRLGDPQAVYPALGAATRLHAQAGRADEATAYADELLALARSGDAADAPSTWVFDLAVALTSLGRGEELLELGAGLAPRTRWLDASVAYASGDLAQAADVLQRIPALPDGAHVRVRGAAELVAAGRRAEADAELAPALAFYRGVGASALLADAEVLLLAAG